MFYMKVVNNQPQEGGIIYHDGQMTDGEMRALDLYPVVEIPVVYNSNYQKLSNPNYVLAGEIVEARYEVINDLELYPKLVEQRLTDFARQRDIEIQEIGLLLNCNNLTWRTEAERFMSLYTDTWTAFYATQSDDWLVIQSELPELTW